MTYYHWTKIKKITEQLTSALKEISLYVLFGLAIGLLANYLQSLTTKSILISFILAGSCYVFNAWREKKNKKPSFKKSSLGENKFNDAISREILSLKIRLDELIESKNPFFKKSKDLGYERSRKQFTHYWRAYSGYQDIAALELYKTPDGRDGGVIILLQQYDRINASPVCFDPLSDIESFTEETLINLHSYGPKKYSHIEKIEEGDLIQAYVFDPEAFGFIKPHQSTIKVRAIQDTIDAGRHITLEILHRKWDDEIFSTEREPILRTIRYANL